METRLSSNQAWKALGYSNFAAAKTASKDFRNVRCYPPVSQPLDCQLTPLEQIAQHAERLVEGVLARSGEAPPVIAKILGGDASHANLSLVVGACSFDQASRVMALVDRLNELIPSTHLLDGCISGTWQIDEVDIINYPAYGRGRGRGNRFRS